MFARVMEDRRNVRRGRPIPSAARGVSLTLTAACLVLVSGAVAVGQKGEEREEFRAALLDLTGRRQHVTVPLYRSITVETTIEATRADVVSKQTADVQIISPTQMLITGEDFGDTSVILIGVDDRQYVFDVHVELDLDRLNESLTLIDPLSDAKATSIRGNIILTGAVSSTDRARRMGELAKLYLPAPTPERRPTIVQNHLDVAGEQQVSLRCVVAEVSRAATRELGINGYLIGENFKDGFIVNQLGGINPINIGAAGGALVTQNVAFLTGENGIPLTQNPTLSLGFPRAQLQVFIKAMADNSLLSVLAEPNLTAISGETATFLAGGEFPIPVPQGNQQVTIEFREFGVRLNFTPIVRGQQRIRLRVAPEVSSLDFSTAVQIEGFVVPGLTSRATETTVEVGSGQTIAIAGMLNEEVRGLASRIPGLGDVPVLGALFRSVNYVRGLTELVVLVTPEIVAPLDAHQDVRLPTDGHTDPTDYELYALGLLDRRPEGEGLFLGKGQGQPEDGTLDSEPDELSLHGPWGPADEGDVR